MATHTGEECARIIQGEANELESFFTSLSPEAWTQPSACAEWQIRDVVAHLASGTQRQLDLMIRGIQGDASPSPGYVQLDNNTASSGNAQRTIDLREKMGGQLLSTFAQGYKVFNETVAGFRPQDWNKLCWHDRRGAISAHAYLELRMQEMGIHGWDIRSSLDSDASLSTRCLPVLVGTVHSWLRRVFRPGPKLASPVHYRFQVSGPIAFSHNLLAEGDDFRSGPVGGYSSPLSDATSPYANADLPGMMQDESTVPDLTFRCDTDIYVLFMYGRLDTKTSIARGRMSLDGDDALASPFEGWFKGA